MMSANQESVPSDWWDYQKHATNSGPITVEMLEKSFGDLKKVGSHPPIRWKHIEDMKNRHLTGEKG